MRKSHILDTIHNYDFAFGKFWNYFSKSDYAKNTIVIFTADRARYPDRHYVKLMREYPDYDQYFVDLIPLIIYDPYRFYPSRFDAQFVSSIDFAPSVAHWVGIEKSKKRISGHLDI